MKPFLFTPDMKLAELIHTNYRLLLLLPRFGLKLGFGEQTAGEYCEKNGISGHLFLMICNIYTFDSYLPDSHDIGILDTHQLIRYLQHSHSYYLNSHLQMIEEQLHLISAPYTSRHRDILKRFFEEYKKEVVHHFDYEEETVFPYILGLCSGEKREGYDIEIFSQNHTNIDDKLHDLKNIIIKYLPGDSGMPERTQVLLHIFSLEEDLGRHTLIEDKILIPLVQQLEKRYGK